MKRLWSPWRLEYLIAPAQESCIFCDAIASQDDRENLVLLRGAHAFLVLNRYPYNNGHLMVVPYAHVPTPEALDAETLAEMMSLMNRALAALRAAMAPEGFNIGVNVGHVAGAGVAEHVHMHVVPRWAGDTNFMPVVGDMRVVPQTWLQTYDQLKAALEHLEETGG
ncbi:MAG: HIT domain-containing protein [Anaerolineae bacterium]|jgi:ATP adenylyltransferase